MGNSNKERRVGAEGKEKTPLVEGSKREMQQPSLYSVVSTATPKMARDFVVVVVRLKKNKKKTFSKKKKKTHRGIVAIRGS